MPCVLAVKKGQCHLWVLHYYLGAAFISVEIYEFVHYVHVGAGITTSAFTSALLTTLGTHGLHVTFGLFWGIFIMIQIAKRGLNSSNSRENICILTILALPGCCLDLHLQFHLLERNDVIYG